MIIFVKKAKIFRLYYMYIAIFFFHFMWKEGIYIRSARSKNENHLNVTYVERTNELAAYISKWNEYNCKNMVTEQTYPGLRHLWHDVTIW